MRSLLPWLESLDGLRRRLRGGVMLLLRVSRRSSRPFPPLRRAPSPSPSGDGDVFLLSLLRESLLRADGLTDLDTDRVLEFDRDLELELRRDLRLLGGGEGDADEKERLRFETRGERDRDLLNGESDLRRCLRSGLLPLPRPPRPRKLCLSGDLSLLRGAGDRDLEGERRLLGGVWDVEPDLAEPGERDLEGEALL